MAEPGPIDRTASPLRFPDSLGHECAAPPQYVRTPRATYVRCPLVPERYPRQSVRECPYFRPRAREGSRPRGEVPIAFPPLEREEGATSDARRLALRETTKGPPGPSRESDESEAARRIRDLRGRRARAGGSGEDTPSG